MKKFNPVLVSGIKMRMRGVRAPILMSVFFCILLGLYTLTYLSMSGVGAYYYMAVRPRSAGVEMLGALYSLLIGMIFVVVVLMVPAMNAGNIASEREKQTLDLLLCSRISAIRIVLGKVLANLAFVVFLLVLSLPLFAITYLFGSIMITDILATFLFMVVCAYACASAATFFSALVKKTSIATILTYVALILLVVLTIVAGAFIYSRHLMLTNYQYDDGFIPLAWKINPVFAVLELLAVAQTNYSGGIGIMDGFLDEISFSFVLYSSVFMLIVSPLLNIASAILIKPVQKFQIRVRKGSGQRPMQELPSSSDPGSERESHAPAQSAIEKPPE